MGCLAQNWEEWLKIGVEKCILEVLREGYKIPFSVPPPLTTHFVVPIAYAPGSVRGQVLQLEIQQLRDKGAIKEAPPFTVICSWFQKPREGSDPS